MSEKIMILNLTFRILPHISSELTVTLSEIKNTFNLKDDFQSVLRTLESLCSFFVLFHVKHQNVNVTFHN